MLSVLFKWFSSQHIFILTTTGTTITTHRSKTGLDLCHLCNLCELLYTNGLELTIKNYKFIFDPVFTHFPKPDFHHPYSDPNSIVDALGSIGVDNTGEYRTMIGNRNGIPGAPLSPQYNIEMLRRIKEGSLLIP